LVGGACGLVHAPCERGAAGCSGTFLQQLAPKPQNSRLDLSVKAMARRNGLNRDDR
jgi:hypothetical protein